MAVNIPNDSQWHEIASRDISRGQGTARVKVYVMATGNEIANNRTYVKILHKSYRVTGTISGSGYQFDCTNCPSQSGSSVWTFDNDETLNSWEGWVGHNSDGTKSFYVQGHSYNSYWGIDEYYGDTVNLVTIPRASTPSITNASTAKNLDSSIAISISRASTSFKHTINIKDGSTIIETLGNKNINTSTTWTPSTATYAPLIKSGDTKTFTIECLTYNGSTHIGTKTCTAILKVLDTTIPSVSITLAEADTTMISKNWGVYVQGKSKLAVTLTATKAYNADISSYDSSIDGIPYTGDSYTTPVLTQSGAQTATATVTDTRNHTSDQATSNYTVVEYNRPSIATALCERCNSDGTPNDEGTALKYTFKASISPVLNGSTPKNTKSFKIYYKAKTSSTWSQPIDLTPSGSTTASYTLNKDQQVYSGYTFSSSTTYVIKFEVTDGFETVSIEREIGTGFDLMNFNTSGKSMAIGKVSEANDTDKLLEVALDSDFKETAQFRKDLTYKGTELNTLLYSIDVPVGTVLPFPSSNIPSGYMLCDGRALSRTNYAELFAIIGTSYGSGDGSTTFNLPNIKGKIPVGLDRNDTDFDALGKTLGEKKHSLSETELPYIDGYFPHVAYGEYKVGGHTSFVQNRPSTYEGQQSSSSNTSGYKFAFGNSDETTRAHNNIQPSIVINYVIKVARGNATVPSSVTITNADVLQITTNKNNITQNTNDIAKNASDIAAINTYSTDEIKIGTWFGKPLYRKCQTGRKTDASQISIALNTSNVDVYTKLYAVIPRSTHESYAGTTNEYYNRSDDMIGTYLNGNSNTLTLRQGSAWPVPPYNYVIVMEYTKTTD